MPQQLPSGWADTTLGEIGTPSRARVMPSELPSKPYVGLEHIEPHTMRLIGHGYGSDARSSSVRFFEGDVLYGKMRPYLNKVWVADFDGLCSSEFLVFSRAEGLNSQFLGLRLSAEDFVAFANGQISGERPRVDFEKVSSFRIGLPPAAEQDVIVAKLQAALSRVSRGQAAARRAQERTTRYRAAVLQAALSGVLTRSWREAQGDNNVETGEAVLQRLAGTRRVYWEKAELKRLREKDGPPKNDRWKSRYREPAEPSIIDLPPLPETWAVASLETVAVIGSGLTVSQNRQVKDPVRLPYLRVANVLRGYLDLSDVKTIRVEKDRVHDYLLRTGDVLFTEGGDRDKLGRGWVWEGQIRRCVHQNHVFRARLLDPALLDPKFVSYWGNTFGQRFFIQYGTQTTNLASINRDVLSRLPVPIPPTDEQAEILREVARRLSAANRLTANLDRQLARARTMREALLREAFAGELIRQDPHDEPAPTLLERIRSNRDRLSVERRDAVRRAGHPQEASMKTRSTNPLLTPALLSAAFDRIGQKPDAKRLFSESGGAPEQVTAFYETLRATPEVRASFEKEAAKGRGPRPTLAVADPEVATKGRFRLAEFWLEDFKNLKDYTVRFDAAHGLEVVLGWNGTGKSNLFEALLIVFRDLHEWSERNRWPDQPMAAYRISYELADQLIQVSWDPKNMKRPTATRAVRSADATKFGEPDSIARTELPLPRFVFGYYSGPTNRLAEHFLPMKQAHYVRLREAKADDAKTLARLLQQRRFFCAETHHAKYVLLAFSYKEDPKINAFLRDRLRIVGFESALFVIRKPRWAKPGSTAEDFWGATGIMRRVMERLRRYAIAPMVVSQTVSDGYRATTEDHYYFFLPSLESLHAFAAEYQDARTFFLALESTDFSELIHDVKIQVSVRAMDNARVAITFHQLSEGEQQLLMVLGLMRFTKSHQSLVLLDEPDTHLNPHWSVDYLKDLTRVMSDDSLQAPEQQSSQILLATHDPLVIASLIKEQVHLLTRDSKTGACRWIPASVNPRGLGFTGILTSEMFGFRSDLDEETLADLDNRVRLVAKQEPLTIDDKTALEEVDKRLADAGFSKAFSDPYYAAFVRAWGRRHSELMAGQQFLTPEMRKEIDRVAGEVLKEAVAEVTKETGG